MQKGFVSLLLEQSYVASEVSISILLFLGKINSRVMKFVYPSFLWALLLMLIPVIIYLVNFRRHQTVYFSNVNFLKKIKKETQRKSKLKQLLILACRVLTIAAIVFAFAKPYKPVGFGERNVSGPIISLYIDNSFSMAAEGPEGIGIESAKQKAYSIVNASPDDSKFVLLTNDLSENHYRFFTKEEIMSIIGDISESQRYAPLSTIISRNNNLTSNVLTKNERKIYLISDFQKNSSDLINLTPDTLNSYNIVPININQVSNIFIDSCWFEAPAHHINQLEEIRVRIVNHSEEEYYNIPVNLFINDSLKAIANVDLQANENKTITLQYANKNEGTQLGRIELNDYPIVYDNIIYFSYSVSSSNNTLLIKSGQNTGDINKFAALFANDPNVSLNIVDVNKLQISDFTNYSSIFLYEISTIASGLISELQKFVNDGGTLTLIPSFSNNTNDYNNLLSALQSVTITEKDTVSIPFSEINYSHPLYNGVFKDNNKEQLQLPKIGKRFRFSANQNISEFPVITFADKSNALVMNNYGKGKVYSFAFPFSEKENQFTGHLLFIPTIYNIALYASSNQQLYATVGINEFSSITNPLEKIQQNPILRNTSTGKEFVPARFKQEGKQILLSVDDNMDAGLYSVSIDNENIGGIALNYNLRESDLSCYSSDELKTLLSQSGIKNFNMIEESNGNLSTAIKELDHGKQFWKLFIFIALLFILLEAAIIKLWDRIFA